MNVDCFSRNPRSAGPGDISRNGRQVLEARYLKRNEEGVVVETPDEMFWRVARTVAEADLSYESLASTAETAHTFFQIMRRLEFLPNSPTLMNAGCDAAQLSACFVLPVEDSLDSIFETVKNMALIHKSGGGTGFSFSRIRPKGDPVRSTRGIASGPVSFMRVFDAATEAVKQGGVRRGANMGILRVDHPDILEFIEAKSNCRELRNFNISVAVTDDFMKASAAGSEYALIHPGSGKPAGHLNARDVFHRMCRRAWECGDPGIVFIDAINRSNPTPDLGSIESTNPCGEQPLLPFEACNLGSINLARMTMSHGGRTVVDYPRLAQTVRTAVHFLDNVIDINRYPLPQISAVTRGNRKIGLGVMGWADLLIQLGVPYGTGQALMLADKVMGFIRRLGHRASADLGRIRGPYPTFPASRSAQDGDYCGRRNATVTTIAPTGTLSIIAGCSGGIEPLFALSFSRRHVLDGEELQEIHPGLLEELNTRGLGKPAILEAILKTGTLCEIAEIPEEMRTRYATAMEISPEWHVQMQAAFQSHSDNAVSKTVNLPFASTPEEVESVYRLAHKLGCKGITVYRDHCRETQVLNIGCVACA